MHFYITGDTHGNFNRIEEFCSENDTTKEDVMIILGDAGINYWLDNTDRQLKNDLSSLDITLFCIHGNHEARPWEAGDYEEVMWNDGLVYMEEAYPNILFAKDGEIYNFHGKKVMAIGGAYSVDKYYRISHKMPLISPIVIEPIQNLKTKVLGNHNPRLHSDEILKPLSISAATNPTAELALRQLPKLRGCEAHSSVILSQVDDSVFRKLGINLTCEAKYQTKKLYHR